jgi:hypothetical protein
MNAKNNAVAGTTAKELRKEQLKVTPKLSVESFEGEESKWKSYLVVAAPEDVPPLLSIGPAPIWTKENHSLIIGKKKSRKTLFLTWLISQYTGDLQTDILIADTEQGQKHVWKTRERIHTLTKKNINILSLRGLSPQDRQGVIEEAIQEGNFKVVIIDGIRDLLSNINDPDQCTSLVTWIEHLTVTYGLHIVNVLHQNKVDNNARGHIGSELLNKAEITIELELDEKAGCTLVKCESARDIPFESFAFTHDAAGLPELVTMPIKGKALTDTEQKNRLAYVFENEPKKYSEVIEGMQSHFEVGKNKAGQLLADYVRRSWIIKNGNDRSPDTVYKLLVSV